MRTLILFGISLVLAACAAPIPVSAASAPLPSAAALDAAAEGELTLEIAELI